jgi:hypothetical protein
MTASKAWIYVVVVIVILIIIISMYWFWPRRQRMERREEVKVEPETIPAAPPVLLPASGSSLHINGVRSALPTRQALSRSGCVKPCVITNFHPFLVEPDGSTHMPLGDWWLMSDTYGACLGLSPDSIVFLTTHGVYHCSPSGSCRLSSHTTPSGIQLNSIHHYDSTIYALGEDGRIYKLLSKKEYDHYYPSKLRAGEVVDLSPHSEGWYWYPIRYFYGLDIYGSMVESITVSLERYPILYLVIDGLVQRWYKEMWSEVSTIVVRGHYFRRNRDCVELLSLNGNIVRVGRGSRQVTCGKNHILYTIDEGWLTRTASDLGNVHMRIDNNWTDLIPLEDSRVIGISSDRTLVLE